LKYASTELQGHRKDRDESRQAELQNLIVPQKVLVQLTQG